MMFSLNSMICVFGIISLFSGVLLDHSEDDEGIVEIENEDVNPGMQHETSTEDNLGKKSYSLGGLSAQGPVKDHAVPGKSEWLGKVSKVFDSTSGSNSKGRERKPFSTNDLKEALKKFKATEAHSDNENKDILEEKKKFRSIDDLKKEFAEMDMTIKTDLEIIRELMSDYSRTDISTEKKLELLQELENLLHQIDNAQNFVDMGGMTHVLRDLNSSDESLRTAAAFVLGSATQGNPKVKVWAVDQGGLECILKQLPRDSMSDTHHNRIMYALSGILRQFPFAQRRFLELDGLRILGNAFDSVRPFGKLQVKMLTLLHDIYSEKLYMMQDSITEEFDLEKQKQYKHVPVAEKLVEFRWCERAASLLALPDHGHKEKVLHALQTFDFCHVSFVSQGMIKQLKGIEQEYQKLISEDTDDDLVYFYTEILTLVQQFLKTLKSKHTDTRTDL